MTGYGEGEIRTGGVYCKIEVRSVNHRFLDINIRLPKKFSPLEVRFRQEIQQRFTRGKFDLSLSWQFTGEDHKELKIDLSLARQFVKALTELIRELNLSGPITPDSIARYRDIFLVVEKEVDLEEVWNISLVPLSQALDALKDMRQKEGEFLTRDIQSRLAQLSQDLSLIKKEFPKVLYGLKDRIQSQINNLFAEVKLEPDRLMQEIVLLTQKSDISEELVRLESHLMQFSSLVEANTSLGSGRKLEFMLQEIHREANTIASKINDFKISQLVINMKNEIEKIREQLQNIE
jgi:uncharacterized protein (TIGR00255 family)